MKYLSGKQFDKTLLTLSVISLVGLFLPDFIYFKKMRIMTSVTISAGTCLGDYFPLILGGVIVIILLSFMRFRHAPFIQGLLAGLIIALSFYFISGALAWLPLDKTEYSRLSIGPVMWLWLICMFGIIVKCGEKVAGRYRRGLLYAFPVVFVTILLLTNNLNGLAIMMEYNANKAQFWLQVKTHITIFFWVMVVSIMIGIPSGYWINRSPRAESILFAIINVTETIPGLAFIGILMIPLAILSTEFPFLVKLGIAGIGVAPAFIALVLYAIFPIIHNTRAGFKTIDNYYIEVAQAMGMSSRKIFFGIMLPMAFPTILSGIRIALVYTITGVSLAAFIGGGGLGIFMLDTESMDLVLLGALPVIIMAFVIDQSLKYVTGLLRFGGINN